MRSQLWFWVLLGFVSIRSVDGTFAAGFRRFLYRTYGEAVETALSRMDIGVRGSVGGAMRGYAQKTAHTPIIVVHGLTNVAADYHELFDEFSNNGYGFDEIYATTYGPKGAAVNHSCTLECSYSKQIRDLIRAVSAYTQSKVHVIGNSLGGPISRKAILGGRCVDTDENLGPPLTDLIDTYFGVAGAMQGSLWCSTFIGEFLPICGNRAGLKIDSDFMKDTNKLERYEGPRILILESAADDLIGFEDGKGKRLLEVAGANRTVILRTLSHERSIFSTQKLQYELLVNDAPDPPPQLLHNPTEPNTTKANQTTEKPKPNSTQKPKSQPTGSLSDVFATAMQISHQALPQSPSTERLNETRVHEILSSMEHSKTPTFPIPPSMNENSPK